MTDPLQQETTYAYDELNRLTTATLPDPDDGGPLPQPKFSYLYDQLSRLISVIDPTSADNSAPTAPLMPTVINTTDAVERKEIDLGAIFQDDRDADSALTFTLMSVADPALFDAVIFTNYSAPRLVLDFAGATLTPAGGVDVVVRATDAEGKFTDHTFTVHRVLPAGHATSNVEFALHATSTGTQFEPEVAALADGGFVAVWTDLNGDDAIRARRFNATGSGVGPEIIVDGIQSSTVTAVSDPNVTGTPDGGFVVTWWRENGQGLWEINLLRYDSAGTALAAAEHVYTAVSSFFTPFAAPSISALNDGRYVITWSSKSANPEDSTDVYARVFESNGTPSGSVFTVNSTLTEGQGSPSVGATDDGGFTVVWQGFGSGQNPYGLYMRHYDADLSAVGAEIQASSDATVAQRLAVVPDGTLVAVWHANSGPGDSYFGVYARLFGADGTPASDPILVNSTTESRQLSASVATTPDGGFVVAWEGNGAGDAYGVFMRRFRRNGTPVDVSSNSELLVNTTTTGSQKSSSLAVTEDGAVAVVWSGEGDVGGVLDTSGVFGRLMPAFDYGSRAGGPFRALSVTPGQSVHGPVDRALVQFSEPIKPGSFSVNDFTLLDPDGAAVTLDGAPVQISQTQWLVTFSADSQVRPGNYTFTVSDQVENSDSSATALIAPYNGGFYLAPGVPTAPYLTAGDPTINLVANARATIDLTAYFTDDQDGPHALTYSVVGVDNATSFISITLPHNQPGTMIVDVAENLTVPPQIFVRATDSDGMYVQATFTLLISPDEFLINAFGSSAAPDKAQLRPMIAATADGGYVASWLEYDTDATDDKNRIMARRFDGAGNPLSGDIEIQGPMNSSSSAYPSSIAVTNSGYFVVVWHQDDGAMDGNFNVYYRRIWLDGTPLDADRRLITTEANKANQQYVPMVAATPDGGFITTHYGGNADSPSADVYFRRFDSNGDPRGDQQTVNSSLINGHFNPAIAVAPDGSFVIAWHGFSAAGDNDVYARKFDAEGIPLNMADQVLNVTMPLHQGIADVAYLDTGKWAVTWHGPNDGLDVYARVLDENGVPMGTSEISVNVTTPNDQRTAKVAGNADGGFTVAWFGFDTHGRGIYARRFDKFGLAIDPSDQLINVETTGHQMFTDVISLADRRLGYAWEGYGPGDTAGVFGLFKPGAAADPGPFRVRGVELPPVVRGPLPGILVTFSEPVDPTTIGVSSFVVKKPDGTPITLNIPVQISATQWYLEFQAATAMNDYGQYSLLIKPNTIQNLAGQLLDQDQDGTPGEFGVPANLKDLSDDHYAVRFFHAGGHAASYSYDADGRLTAEVDAGGNLSVYAYSPASELISQIDPLARVTRYAYDARGLLTQMILPDLDGIQATMPPSYAYQYDAVGNLTHLTEPDRDGDGPLGPSITQYIYDARYRLTDVFQPNPVNGDADLTGPNTQYKYDAAGQLKEMFDPLSRKTLYDYDGLGRLKSLTAPDPDLVGGPNGPVTSYEYDALGNLTRLTAPDPDGAGPLLSPVTDYAYDAHYNLTQVTAPDPDDLDGLPGPLARPVTQYAYDDAGRLIRMTAPVRTGPAGSVAPVTEYKYDHLGRLTDVFEADPATGLAIVGGAPKGPVTNYQYDVHGNLARITDPLGRATQYGYDALNRPVAAVDPLGGIVGFGYDGAGNLTSRTDQLGRSTRLAYDGMNRLVSRTLPDPDAAGPLTAPVTSYGYDAVGNLTGMFEPARLVVGQANPVAPETTYTYDALNRLTEVRRPDPATGAAATGPLTSYQYDAASQLTKLTAPARPGPAGVVAPVTEYRYDNLGRLTDVFAPHATTGLATSGGSPIGPVTHYDYDRLSRRTQVVAPDPDGAGGNLLSPVTTYEYDGLSRVTRMEEPDPDAVVGNAGPLTRPVTTYEYDAASQLLRETDPLLRTVDYDYDYLGRTTTVTRQAGDPLQQVTEYQFDAVGNLLAMTEPDPDGAGDLASPVTRYAYDRLDRRTEIVDPREGRTTFTFDAVGNLASLADPVGNTTFFTYDRLDRQTAETVHLSSTPGATAGLSSSARTYEYDAAGQLTQKADRLGRVTKYGYDALGRRLTEDWFADAADPATDRTLNFTYDVAGQLTAASDPAAAYDFQYDYLGRTTKLTHDLAGLSFDVVFDQLFDDLGRRTELGAKINQWNDFLNKYTYDGLSRLTRVTQEGQGPEFPVADKRVDFTYNAIGQLDTITRSSDLAGTSVVAVSDYQYDTLARLTDIDHDKADQTLIAGYGYTLDGLNRITGVDFKNPAHDAEDVTFNYDATDQLINADRAGTTEDESYVHDLNGNRAYDSYETESHNRLSTDGTYDFQYDVEGNRTKRTEIATGDYAEYSWDHRNRLTSVTFKTSAGITTKGVTYEYDAFDNRIAKHLDSNGDGTSDRDEFFISDLESADGGRFQRGRIIDTIGDSYVAYGGDHVVFDFVDADGAGVVESPDLAKRYLHGPATDQVLAQEDVAAGSGSAADVDWLLSDHLGTIRDIVDSTGALVLAGHLAYDSFGNVISGDQSLTRYQFTGREWDADAELFYYRARWYDPATGRFLSEDPLGFSANDPNLSRYVGNSPVTFTDPSGLEVNPDDIYVDTTSVGGIIASSLHEARRQLNILRRLLTAYEQNQQNQLKARLRLEAEIRRVEIGKRIICGVAGTEPRPGGIDQFESTIAIALLAAGEQITDGVIDSVSGRPPHADTAAFGIAGLADSIAVDLPAGAERAAIDLLAALLEAESGGNIPDDALEDFENDNTDFASAQNKLHDLANRLDADSAERGRDSAILFTAAELAALQAYLARLSSLATIEPATVATVESQVITDQVVTRQVLVRHLHGRQLRCEFSSNNIKRLKRSMRTNGFDPNSPIDIVDIDGRMIIIDGHHRARAAGAAGIKKVPVRIRPVTPEEAAELLRQAAEAAGDLGLPFGPTLP